MIQFAVKLSEFGSKILDQWTPCLIELKENYGQSNENYKYLGTLQDFLIVMIMILRLICLPNYSNATAILFSARKFATRATLRLY